MKKYLLIALCLVLFKNLTPAAPIVIPGSAFPVQTTLGPTDRILVVRTNNSPSTNVTIRYDDLEAQLNAVINPTFPWVIVTNGSSTATIQAQANSISNVVLAFQPGDYTNSATLLLTNGSYIVLGNGAILHMPVGMTNQLIDTGTNFGPRSLVIDNLRFDGGTYIDWNDIGYFELQHSQDANPYFNQYWTNRTGLRAEVSGGVIIQNCYFYGFSGNGAVFLSQKTSSSFDYPKLVFSKNHCFTNFQSVLLAGTREDTLAYYNNDITPSTLLTCEYAMLNDNDIIHSYIGVSASPGNCKIDHNYIDENFIALLQTANTGNDTHGTYCNNSFNHNNFAIWSWQNIGGLFAGNIFGRNGQSAQQPGNTNIYYPNGSTSGIHFDNVLRIMFTENNMTREYLTFTNGCLGIFAHNTFGSVNIGTSQNQFLGDSNLVWGIDIPTNFCSTMQVFDNWEVLGQHNDYSTARVLSDTNVWPPTFYSLQARNTNQGWQTMSNSVPPKWWFGHFDASSNVVFDGHF